MIIEFEGQQFEFPDDASQEEISQALSSMAPQEIPRDIMTSRAPENRPQSAVESIVASGQGPTTGESFVTGLKQGVKDIGAGIVQRGAELLSEPQAGGIALDRPVADLMALTDRNELQTLAESKQQEIERKASLISPELQLAQEQAPVSTFFGRSIGQMVALPLGGPAAQATGVAKILGGSAAGAAFSFVQPTSKDEDALSNAVLGAVAGGTITAFSNGFLQLIRKGVNAGNQAFQKPEIVKLIREAYKRNIPIFSDDVVQSPFLRFVSRASEEIPVVGTAGGRIKQNEATKAATAAFMRTLRQSDGDLDGVILSSLNNKTDARRLHAGQLWSRVARETDSGGPVPINKAIVTAQRELAEELQRGPQASAEVVKTLNNMIKTEPGNFSFHTESTKPYLSGAINQFYNGDAKSLGKKGVEKLTRVKQALDEDLKDFAKAHSKEAFDLWQRANTFTGRLNEDLRKTGLKNLVRTNEPEKIMAFLSTKGGIKSRNELLYRNLTPNGRAAVRNAVVHDAWEASVDPGTGIFDSRKFVSNVRDRQGIVDIFFKDRDFVEIEGLLNVLKATEASAATAVSRGGGINTLARRLITGPVGLGTVAAGAGGFGAGGAGGAVGAVAGAAALVGPPAYLTKLLTQSEKSRDFLLAAGEATPGTLKFDKIMKQINQFIIKQNQTAAQQSRESERP